MYAASRSMSFGSPMRVLMVNGLHFFPVWCVRVYLLYVKAIVGLKESL